MENRKGYLIDEDGKFHPENMSGNDARNDILFKKFVSADANTFATFAVALEGQKYDVLIFRYGDQLHMLDHCFVQDDGRVRSFERPPFAPVDPIEAAVTDFALGIACEKTGLSRDEFMSKLVDNKLYKDVEHIYLFDEDGAFHPENIYDVDDSIYRPVNEIYLDNLAFKGADSMDRLCISFDNGGTVDSFEDALNNAIKAGKLTLHDKDYSVSDYAYYDLLNFNIEGYPEDFDLPKMDPYYIDTDIRLVNGEFKLTGMSLQYIQGESVEPEYRCDNCFDLTKFSESEKKAIVDFALDVACTKSGLSKDEIKGKLIDQNSEYAKLKSVSEKGNSDENIGYCDREDGLGE